MTSPETVTLHWWWNSNREELNASSLYHDSGSPLVYRVSENLGYRVSESKDNFWQAMFEGSRLCYGTLEQCLHKCAEYELEAMREAIAKDVA